MRTIFPLMAVSLVLALPPAASAQEARPPIVAVMNIEAVGVTLPAPVLDRLTLFLTTRLGATNRFLVVPREQVKRRLVELKKNSYRADCDQSCQIDLGQALSAQKTVATQIIKAGSACTVAINVLDLKREASEGGASIDGKCDEDGIVLSLKAAVARMAGDAAASKPAPVGGAGPGGAAGPAQAVDSTSGAPAACPPGQAIGQDTAGHCCWPAQA